MKPVSRCIVMVVLTLTFISLGVAPAMADEAVLVSREVETVTGVELACALASQVTAVRLVPTGVAVTLERDGVSHTIDIDVLAGEEGEGSSLAALAGLFSAVTLVTRVTARLGRFFRV